MATIPTYTREDLITICEQAVVPESKWLDRDSHRSQCKVGEAWALLKAGCDFKVLYSGVCATDDKTIWIEIYAEDFNRFEWGREVDKWEETYYLPTRKRLEARPGQDWY